jgi:hypothetical protein
LKWFCGPHFDASHYSFALPTFLKHICVIDCSKRGKLEEGFDDSPGFSTTIGQIWPNTPLPEYYKQDNVNLS